MTNRGRWAAEKSSTRTVLNRERLPSGSSRTTCHRAIDFSHSANINGRASGLSVELLKVDAEV